MKAMSLPINMIVIIALAVIVLLGVSAFFMGSFGPGSQSVSATNAWNAGCGMAKMRGCDTALFGTTNGLTITGYKDSNGNIYTLNEACNAVYGTTDATACQNYCCGTTTSTTP